MKNEPPDEFFKLMARYNKLSAMPPDPDTFDADEIGAIAKLVSSCARC